MNKSDAGILGSGVLTAWIWNSLIVPFSGLAEMPVEVAPAAALAMWRSLEWIGIRLERII